MTGAFDPLADEPRWVTWRQLKRRGKATKVPYAVYANAREHGLAATDDPTTWGTRTRAESRARKFPNGPQGGIGIVLGDLGTDCYLAGFDADSCIDQAGCLAQWAETILAELDTYCETSPSGTGVKGLFYIAADDVRRFLDLVGVDAKQWGCRRSIPGLSGADHGPAIELYCSHRYFAITERLWPGKPNKIALLDWPALERLAKAIPPAKSTGGPRGGDDSRSAIAWREGRALKRAGKTFEEMVAALEADPETADWVREKGHTNDDRELHRIYDSVDEGAGVSLGDFYAYMPMHAYIYAPTREMWPAGSVNARIPPIGDIRASLWLDQHKPVEQMTWCPGLPMIIKNKLVSQGGWIERADVSCFNLYRPPEILPGNPVSANKWRDHVKRVFPDDADHITRWLAHRVQRPQEKINHALVLGGLQGIGKDTILEPVKRAIGPWNFQEASAEQVMGRFTSFLKSVILRISEARDLGNVDRFKLYEHLKAYTAAPPDVLRCDEKHIREYAIFNICGVIITTNHKTNGIYLPADDRHYVAWSDLAKDDFPQTYWQDIYAWYDRGGTANVAAYLAELDLSDFNPKAPPAQTTAFWEIVDASRVPEDAELADVLDGLGWPAALTLKQIVAAVLDQPFHDWLIDRRNSRLIPHRLEECGYVAARNLSAKDGLWKVHRRRQVIYAKAEISQRERYVVASELSDTGRRSQ